MKRHSVFIFGVLFIGLGAVSGSVMLGFSLGCLGGMCIATYLMDRFDR